MEILRPPADHLPRQVGDKIREIFLPVPRARAVHKHTKVVVVVEHHQTHLEMATEELQWQT